MKRNKFKTINNELLLYSILFKSARNDVTYAVVYEIIRLACFILPGPSHALSYDIFCKIKLINLAVSLP
jgi:hypothetical protein